jgi:hypothetical protein
MVFCSFRPANFRITFLCIFENGFLKAWEGLIGEGGSSFLLILIVILFSELVIAGDRNEATGFSQERNG